MGVVVYVGVVGWVLCCVDPTHHHNHKSKPKPLPTHTGNVVEQLVDYPLPAPPAAVDAAGGFNYPNSNGFQYEAAAVQRCIARGLGECPQYTAEESLAVARIMDEVRTQLGVKSVDEA